MISPPISILTLYLKNIQNGVIMFNLFDCHCDTLTKAMSTKQNLFKNNLHIDIERFNKFNKVIQVFAIWLDKEYLESPFISANKFIDFYNTQLEEYKQFISNDMDTRITGVLALEGAEAIEGDLDKLHYFYNRTVRLMTLTWNDKNAVGYGAMTNENNGLTPFGIEVVKEMNKLNMMIDVSHLNERGFYDIYNHSERSFIASHSNASNIFEHPRNLTKDQLRAIAESKSMVCINLFPEFIDGGRGKLDSIIKHIDFIMNIVGDRQIGLGCDFDGISYCPEELEDISKITILYNRIVEIWGKNVGDCIFYNNLHEYMSAQNIYIKK